MRTGHRDRPGKRPNPGIDRPPPNRSQGEEWLYGRNGVAEALRAGRRRFRRIVLLRTAGKDARLLEIERRGHELGIPTERVERHVIDMLLPEVNHQGVAALVTSYPYASSESLEVGDRSMLALDHLVDPQNVGTLLRSAEAFGVRTVLLPRDRAAGITPAVVNASAGAVEHLSIVQVVNLAHEFDRLKKRGIWIVGIENAERASVLGTTPVPTPCALVIGSEGSGMSPNLAKHCDLLLRIEMRGRVDSLNAATAGSIALYELSRS